jgi:uncharacterized peroxidase-related enzyme
MVTLDDELVAALRRDWRTAPISDRERVMLEYVEKLTLHPATVGRADVDALRDAGFDDRGILQIACITGFFAYVNRIADGIGVGRD